MTPEERREIYPPFIVRETEKIYPPNFRMTKITDFLPLVRAVWKISNKKYQERFWVRQERPLRGDNYMETTMTFNEDAEGVLESTRIEMTDKQREMLTRFYNMLDEYEDDPEAADDLGYGINDEAIVNDPKWDKVRQYAKLVYEEITGEKA